MVQKWPGLPGFKTGISNMFGHKEKKIIPKIYTSLAFSKDCKYLAASYTSTTGSKYSIVGIIIYTISEERLPVEVTKTEFKQKWSGGKKNEKIKI